MPKDIQSEYSGIASYVLLDWYVRNYYITKKQCIILGDNIEIASADLAAIEGLRLCNCIRGRLRPILKLGFELSQEYVPGSNEMNTSNVYFLSFGLGTDRLEKSYAVKFIFERLEKLNLPTTNMKFKLYYLPPLPITITTEGFEWMFLGGYANIEKDRAEINVFPPRDYSKIFKNLVHEIIHVCLFQTNRDEDSGIAENKVEEYVKIFLETFSDDIKSEQDCIFKELKDCFEEELKCFSQADKYLISIMKLEKIKVVIGIIINFFNAIQSESIRVTIKN